MNKCVELCAVFSYLKLAYNSIYYICSKRTFSLAGKKEAEEMPLAGSEAQAEKAEQKKKNSSLLSKIKNAIFG